MPPLVVHRSIARGNLCERRPVSPEACRHQTAAARASQTYVNAS